MFYCLGFFFEDWLTASDLIASGKLKRWVHQNSPHSFSSFLSLKKKKSCCTFLRFFGTEIITSVTNANDTSAVCVSSSYLHEEGFQCFFQIKQILAAFLLLKLKISPLNFLYWAIVFIIIPMINNNNKTFIMSCIKVRPSHPPNPL